MIDFTCEANGCDNQNVQYNFLGNPETAICGGCKATLIGTNERPDPEIVNYTITFPTSE